MTKAMPTMQDVARRAGVTAQTVSRTLAGGVGVKASTRKSVIEAVEELGYRKTNLARVFASGRSRLLGLIVTTEGSYARSDVMTSIETTIQKLGYFLTIATADSLNPHAVEESAQRLMEQGVEGLLLALPLLEGPPDLAATWVGIPTVTIDGLQSSAGLVMAVDQNAVGRIATQHLLDLGHRRIHHISGPAGWRDASERIKGWRKTLADSNASGELYEASWTAESAYHATRRMLNTLDATAIFVASDEMAIGVIRALTVGGLSVPDDVSIISVDNIPLAAYTSPALTTVEHSYAATAAAAATYLVHTLDSAVAHELSQLPDPEPMIVLRESTAPPNP